MKKLLYLFLAITIISCGGDDDSGNANNNSSNLTINPPSWIHGVYLLENIDGSILPLGYEFKSETDVYEESDSNRYFIELTIGVAIYEYEFEKVSSTSIRQILPTGENTYILQ